MGPYEATQPRRKGKIKGPAPIKQGRAKDSEGQDIVPIDVKEFQTYLEQHQCVGVRLPTILYNYPLGIIVLDELAMKKE